MSHFLRLSRHIGVGSQYGVIMRVIIIGGGYAGVACALRLARRLRGNRGKIDIHLVNDTDDFVERIRLHQHAAGGKATRRRLQSILKRAGVKLVIGRAEAIDTKAQQIFVKGKTLSWDRLVLALGSSPQAIVDGAHVLGAENGVASAARIKVLAAKGGTVTVVGGGLTGIEVASEIAERFPGLDVALISRSPLAKEWSAPARAHVLTRLERLGVRLSEGVTVPDAGGDGVPGDLILSTVGFGFSTLAREAGLAVNAAGQVLVDPCLRSLSHPVIYAAGDCAAPVLAPGDPLPMGCKSALPMGAQIGDNIAREISGREPDAFDFALAFYCVSLGRRDGLIQYADRRGTPTGRVLTGRRAAWFKEFVCRMTWWALVFESRGIPFMMGKRTGRAPQALPADFVYEANA